MPHPIYGPPSHRLETVHFVLRLPTRVNKYLTTLEVRGESPTQRASLWAVSESWTTDEQVAGLQPSDAIHHLALIVLQDRPENQAHVFRCLTGENYIEEELPFT